MADLPPADHPQDTPARRSGARRHAARQTKSTRPLPAESAQHAEQEAEEQEKEPSLTTLQMAAAAAEEPQNEHAAEELQNTLESVQHPAQETQEPAEGASRRGLTPLSKQILLWGSIIGGINILYGVATTIFYLNFASTDAQIKQNSGVIQGVVCLSFLVSLVLPFLAGWRATIREGLGRHGALAAFWSLVLTLVVEQIGSVIIASIQGQLGELNGAYYANQAANFLTTALISVACGWLGGSLSSRQRLRAQQRQEAEAEITNHS